MKGREKEILEMVDELKSICLYESYETLLDEMMLVYVQSEYNGDSKGNAYWMVMNLKKLFKVACN